MPSTKRSWRLSAVCAMGLLLLSGCAHNSPPTPPEAVPGVKLTPLPASVRNIDSTPSVGYSQKVLNFLSKVEELLKDETPK